MESARPDAVRFHEVQCLRDTWLPWFMLVSTGVSMVVVVAVVAGEGDVVDVHVLSDLPGRGTIRVGAALVAPWASEVHYLVHRDGGVRVERRDGRPLVVSSRRADDLAAALRAASGR